MESPAAIALGVGVSAAALTLVFFATYRRFERIGKAVENNYKQLEGLVSILACLQPERPLPPLRDWAISPDLAHIIISNVFLRRPENILEFGSGTSTLLLGYCLKKLGRGKVWSIEHDGEYAEAWRKAVQSHGLEDRAAVIHAPLCKPTSPGWPPLWYDLNFLEGVPPVDMVIVDGPPSHLGEMMRYPALPSTYPLLAKDAILIMDDAFRVQERKVVGAWLEKFPDFECQWVDTEKGTAILRRVSSPARSGLNARPSPRHKEVG